MNKTLQEGIALAEELNQVLAADKPNCDVIIGTPFIHLAKISDIIDHNVIGLSAENCADKESGAYTGEVSAAMVKSTGAEYVILGHSERREYYHETYEILKEKVLLALANGLKVIFCIGESLDEREKGIQNQIVKAELEGSVFNLLSLRVQYSISQLRSSRISPSPTSLSGLSVPVRPLLPSRLRRSTLTSVQSSLTSTESRLPRIPLSSTVAHASLQTLQSSLQNPTSTVV